MMVIAHKEIPMELVLPALRYNGGLVSVYNGQWVYVYTPKEMAPLLADLDASTAYLAALFSLAQLAQRGGTPSEIEQALALFESIRSDFPFASIREALQSPNYRRLIMDLARETSFVLKVTDMSLFDMIK